MGRIAATFADLKAKGEKALIPYFTAGDPALDFSRELLLRLPEAGADLIELGVPFSDPIADGPTIQRAANRALAQGAYLDAILDLVQSVRSRIAAPMVLFGYYNPIFKFGVDKFAQTAAAAGVDGVLIVDVPPEEADEIKAPLDAAGLDFIFLLTPVSDKSRIKLILPLARGFIYYVSVTGVTGARTDLPADLTRHVAEIKAETTLPICVGFGISRPEQAQAVAQIADGVVVGSALVSIIEKCGASPGLVKDSCDFIRSLKQAMVKAK